MSLPSPCTQAQMGDRRVQVGDWLVEPSLDMISRGGERHKLEPRTMRLLVCLIDADGRVVSRERLLAEVWAGVVVGPASVYQAISQLRKLLRDVELEPRYIATVPRKGYRLIPKMRMVEQFEHCADERGADLHPVSYRSITDHTIGGSVVAMTRIPIRLEIPAVPAVAARERMRVVVISVITRSILVLLAFSFY